MNKMPLLSLFVVTATWIALRNRTSVEPVPVKPNAWQPLQIQKHIPLH